MIIMIAYVSILVNWSIMDKQGRARYQIGMQNLWGHIVNFGMFYGLFHKQKKALFFHFIYFIEF